MTHIWRPFLYVFLCFLLSGPVAAQSNDQLLVKVRIDLKDRSLGDLAKLGIDAEHGYNRVQRTLTNIYTTDEIKLIKDSGFHFTVLNEDVMKAYMEQSAKAVPYEHQLESRTDACGRKKLTFSKPTNFHYGSMGYYLTYNELMSELDRMHQLYPNLISAKTHNSSFRTKRGNYLEYVKISDNPDQNEMADEPQILYTALHHAREPMSMAQLVYFMWYVLENYDKNPEIKYLVDNTELFFMPCVNPDGYLYNQAQAPNGGGNWRKNRNYDTEAPQGVDLNRNYGFAWGYDDSGSSPVPTSDTYRGYDGFSEQETKAVRSLVKSNNFSLAINYHSYANEIIYPWGYNPANCIDSLTYISFAELLSKYTDYGYGLNVEVLDYPVNGAADDWMYNQGTPNHPLISLTTECGAAEDNEANSFWPTVDRIVPICDEMLSQNITSMWLVHNKVSVNIASEKIITQTFDTLKINVTRDGLLGDPVSIRISPVSSSLQPFDREFTFSKPHLEKQVYSVPFYNTNPHAKVLSFKLAIDYGGYIHFDTLTVDVMPAKVIFASDGNDLSLFQFISSENNWVITNKEAYIGTSSFAVTKNEEYDKASDKQLITKNKIQLPNDNNLKLSFFAKWYIEKNIDYFKVYASEDGHFWSPLCGNLTTPGSLDQILDEPVLDGYQPNWENVLMDLTEYAGKSVYLKFLFRSDARWNKTGIFLDKIRVLSLSEIVANDKVDVSSFRIYPNPATDVIKVEGNFTLNSRIELFNSNGIKVLSEPLSGTSSNIEFSKMNFPSGFYIYKISSEGNLPITGKLIIN